MSAAGWARFEVEADVGVHGWGPTPAEAFAQATLGVFALLVAPDEVQALEHRAVRAQADTPEALLVAWIGECLYVHEIEDFVVRAVEMTTCTDVLAHGILHGEPVAPGRHRVRTVVKGATRQGASVRLREDGGWDAKVIVDV